jgi:hypothetical protein
MIKHIKYFGLCMSCRNASVCTFPRDPAMPAFYCEEFEIETPVSDITAEKRQPFVTVPAAGKKDSSGLAGLCIDCEGRKNCSFPKSEGGVWHCEEYR